MSTETFNSIFESFSSIALIILGVIAILCLLRAMLGPKPADRIVACNMMGTVIMAIIAIVAVRLGEGYLGDICLVYAMISFLAVIVLCKVYYGAYMAKKKVEEERKNNGNA